ncbi:hypothetical protein O181_009512 [Austropuccinia psidii MF-1]|uniref:Uncharacterized protein n=1 Tax=Austropuccinia psidii MF-1 TaxID=1389203 RepID=A0A9Q3GKD5_9BASI|nr:hypothetical protein [Austropuccinia psidii MF-1]
MSHPYDFNHYISPLSYAGLGHKIRNEDNDRHEKSNTYLLPPINSNLYAQSLPSTHASTSQIYTPCTHASSSQIYTQMPVENSRISGSTYHNWSHEDYLGIRTAQKMTEGNPSERIGSYQQESLSLFIACGQEQAAQNDQNVKCSQTTTKRKHTKVADVDYNNNEKAKIEIVARRDKNLAFSESYFEHICDYLEDEQNYNYLFDDSKKTQWANPKHTRLQAFGRFAKYLNLNHKKETLLLDARKLQQHWQTYKHKYVIASRHERTTGAGTEHEHGLTLEEKLENQCPFYWHMYAIFGKKSNVQGINVKDTSSKGKNKQKEETHSESDDDIDSHNYSEKNEISSGNDKVEEVVVVDKKVISPDAEIVLVKTESKPKKSGPKGSLPSQSVNVRDKGVLGT